MADRYPLVVDSSNYRIEELPSGDSLDLTGASIKGLNVTGVATFSSRVVVSSGTTISPSITGSGSSTGIFFPDSERVAVSVAGTTPFNVYNDRVLIGFGTTANLYGLDYAPLQIYAAQNTIYNWIQSDDLENTGTSGHYARGKKNGATRNAVIGVYWHSGLTNPAGYMDLEREDGSDGFVWTDNTGDLRISGVNTHIGTTAYGTVIGDQTSDERVKDILGEVTYGLNEIKNINPVKYRLKSGDRDRIGFVAQELQNIVPESVYDTGEFFLDEENNPIEGEPTKLAMEYVALIPVLVNAIKELKAEVDALKGA